MVLSSAFNELPLDLLQSSHHRYSIGGEKPTGKPWKMEPFSSESRPHIKNRAKIFLKSFPSPRGARIDETEQSDRQMDLEDARAK